MIWNFHLGENSVNCKELVILALQNEISKKNEALLIDTIRSIPDFSLECGLTPDKLPVLIENSPNLAFELMLSIDSTPRKKE